MTPEDETGEMASVTDITQSSLLDDDDIAPDIDFDDDMPFGEDFDEDLDEDE